MRIIEPSATLEWLTPDPLGVIERAGRTCYQSEPKGDPAAFVRMLLKCGHESVIEHAAASFRIVTDRGVTHELVRHRLASYSQESTRYCRYGDGIAVIEPPGLAKCRDAPEPGEANCQESTRYCRYGYADEPLCGWHRWAGALLAAEDTYLELLARGLSPQIARSVLPTCTKTEIVATANLREWRHILRMRTAPAAHPQMRQVADLILAALLGGPAAVVFEDLAAPSVPSVPSVVAPTGGFRA